VNRIPVLICFAIFKGDRLAADIAHWKKNWQTKHVASNVGQLDMVQDQYQKQPFCAFTALTISPRGKPYVRWVCRQAARPVLFYEILQ
jgi:uncharacterized protein YfaQ (DUF2300 family)